MAVIDPYSFGELLTDYDIYLLRQGQHFESFDKLGAQVRTIDGVAGVSFIVWAPNAQTVSVVGDFNRWDERMHPMRQNRDSGFWELFIPSVEPGAIYRFHIRSRVGSHRANKSDPYGFYSELRPANASVVWDINRYIWGDDKWLEERAKREPFRAPLSIYEVHLGSWQRGAEGSWLTYREIAEPLISYVRKMGYTHIELMPITEYPFDGSWGYQVTGYFAATSRYGTPDDFMYFVDQCHQHNIGVILDWVPAHFPKDGHALAYFDGTHLYEHADPRQGEHPDWGTYIFNYGRNEVRNFLLSSALFWVRKYHIDGLRVDAVSSMLYLDYSRKAGQWMPNRYGGNENLDAISLLRDFNTLIHTEHPGVMTIAEESTSWPMVSRPVYIGGLGFTFKWNMGWMNDTLQYFKLDPIARRYHHNLITFMLVYAFSENFILSISHDEVVHLKGSLMTKMSGDWWQKFASLRLMFGMQFTLPGKKLGFMGQEFGQWNEWSETRALDWHLLDLPTHRGMHDWVRDLNHFYVSEPALYENDTDYAGFEWLEVNDIENSVFAYTRHTQDKTDFLLVVANCTPVVRKEYRVGVPSSGRYREIFNSDAVVYHGSGVGNAGVVRSEPIGYHDHPQSLKLTLPPLGLLIFKHAGAEQS